MAKRFVNDAAIAKFTEAIKAVEAESSVEVVIKVRHHSGSYLHADLIAGIVLGVAALAFMLFSERFHFSLMALLIDPILVGIGGGFVSTQLPAVRRWLTLPRARRKRVIEAARAGFFLRGVRHTSDKTGILVYASLLEKDVMLVCDRGVTEAITRQELAAEEDRLRKTMHSDFRGVALADAIAELKTVCGQRLPRREDDVNELPDQVFHE